MLNARTRVLVADDHALVRSTVVDHLRRDKRLEVVGAADNAERAVSLARELEPDILLLDVDLDGTPSLPAARKITADLPDVRLIFVSGFVCDRYIQQALDMDAAGYVSKRDGLEVLVEAVHEVAGGGNYFSQDVTRRLVCDRAGVHSAEGSKTRSATLTDRERQILADVARGLAKKDIARNLGLSVKTVERHCENLMAKLELRNRVELARFAIREGIVDP